VSWHLFWQHGLYILSKGDRGLDHPPRIQSKFLSEAWYEPIPASQLLAWSKCVIVNIGCRVCRAPLWMLSSLVVVHYRTCVIVCLVLFSYTPCAGVLIINYTGALSALLMWYCCLMHRHWQCSNVSILVDLIHRVLLPVNH